MRAGRLANQIYVLAWDASCELPLPGYMKHSTCLPIRSMEHDIHLYILNLKVLKLSHQKHIKNSIGTLLVVLTHLKNISQNGNLPQIEMKIKNI